MQKETLSYKESVSYKDGIKDNIGLEEGYIGNPGVECLRNFSERMKNIAPFACVVKRLGNLQKYPDYDMFSLGMGVMLFVLENMLIGREECSIEEIGEFLQTLIFRVYKENLTQEDSRELAFYIRDAISGSGESYQFEYDNLEKAVKESVAVTLMDVSFYEIKKTSKYKLTDQGMELLFKTREIFSEFRLNVTQLYLRQQIEKGVFVGALQTVNELSLQVRQLREKIENIMEGIRQNVLGVEFNDLNKLLERVQEQFKIERKEFSNIRSILGEQRNSIEAINFENISEKELRALKFIGIISEKIETVSKEHDRLFNEKIDIIGEYLRMLEFRMRSGITEFMDFERFVFDKLGSDNLPIEALGRFLSPLFLDKAKHKEFNIMRAFSPQKIRNEEAEEKESVDLEGLLEKKEKEQRIEAEKRNGKIEIYLERIFLGLLEKPELSVKNIIENMDKELYLRASTDFDFFSLLVILHQKQEIDFEVLKEISDSFVLDVGYNINLEFLIGRVLEKNKKFKDFKKIGITSNNKTFKFDNDNVVTDFLITRY